MTGYDGALLTVPAWKLWLAKLLGQRVGSDGVVTIYRWRGHYYVDLVEKGE